MPITQKEAPIAQAPILKQQFGTGFKWGVSAAAFQTEGTWNEDGKGPSVWDTFTARRGKIYKAHNASIACDFYHRYKQDLDIMQSLAIPNFRFSTAWSRILPMGKGRPNTKGIGFYDRLIDSCLQRDITPWITLYHWDLPQALEDQGGWRNRSVLGWLEDYAALCAKQFGDRVKHWMVLNEPMAFTGVGYFLGIHAPGRRGLSNFLPAMHHAALSQAAGGRVLKSLMPQAEVGSTFSYSHIEPYRHIVRDEQAALRMDALLNRTFLEPALGLGYPVQQLPLLKRIEKYMQPDDENLLAFDFDFLGLQTYTREVVKHSFFTPYVFASLVKAAKRGVSSTDMGWEVYPPSIYHAIKRFAAYPNAPKIYITENGAAFPDQPSAHGVHDIERTAFLQNYLCQVLRAKKEGAPVQGYFVWTFTDNFEWAEGYRPRFGLVHVDFSTQVRVIKDSGYWYRDFLKS